MVCLVVGREALAGVPDCVVLAEEAERQYRLPEGILQSISTVEASRIHSDGSYRAWPWTLNDSGKGLFFDNRQQVLDYLDVHMTNPDTSIDIGCMQINTKWHGAAFETLDEMLDPASNIAYAAGFLTDLYYAHGNWNEAIRHYHSNDRRKNDPYLDRVLTTWTEHHPNAQDARIQTAVFQLPLEPISTAAEDSFAEAMASKEETTSSQPVALPITIPAAKPVISAMVSNLPDNPGKNLQAVRVDIKMAKVTAKNPTNPSAEHSPEPVDLDQRVKKRQKNLLEQWDRVLMFRTHFATTP